MAKIVQTEGRTSSLLECYAEVQPIFCKDTKKIETTIPFNSIFFIFHPKIVHQGATKLSSHRSHRTHRSFWRKVFSHRLHGYTQIRSVWHPAIPTQPPNYIPTEFTEHTETSGAIYSPTDCTDAHRLGGYGIPAIPTQPPNYLPTEPYVA